MPHIIFTGTFAALEERFLDYVAAQQKDDPLAPVAVLLGSNILAWYLTGCIARRGHPAANLRFYTFAELASRLATLDQGARRKPRLPPMGASLQLEDLLTERTPAPFVRVAGYAGFRAALLDTFRDLADAGIPPEALEHAGAAGSGLTSDRSDHWSGLAELYRRFRSRTAPFRDPAADFRSAAAAASRAESLSGTRSLAVYGIYDVTGIQADLLHSLKDFLDLVYFIPYAEESAGRFARPFLDSVVRDLGAAPARLQAGRRDDSLGELSRRLFASPSEQGEGRAQTPLAADGSFALVTVPGDSRAAVEVVREILQSLRDGIITGFHEAAVLLRQHEDEVPILAEAFRLRSIPYYIHGGSAFSSRPLAQAVLAIAGLEAESFSRRAILTAMELTAAALPDAGAALGEVSSWRTLVQDARFLAGVPFWDAGTEALIRDASAQLRLAEDQNGGEGAGESEGEDRSRPSVRQARRRLESAVALRHAWMALRRAAADWPEARTWREWSRWLRDRLEPLLGRSVDWPALPPVLDDLEALGALPSPDRRVPRARLSAVLKEALDGLSCEEGRFRRRGVNLLSIAAARGLRFPLLIIPGLDEGRFPARPRQDPLLLDDERRRIDVTGRLPVKSLRAEEEILLFSMSVRAAEKRLVLMTSRLDESSDRERIPSQFFLRCAAAAAGRSLRLAELTPEAVPGLRSVSLDAAGPGKGLMATDEGEIRLGLIAEGPDRGALDAIAAAEPRLMDGPLAYDRARFTRGLTAFDGNIRDATLRSWVGRRLQESSSQLSASRVEEYARCPYLFYLRRVLGLEKWQEEESADGIDPLLRGLIIHEILESFLRDFNGARFDAQPIRVRQLALETLARQSLQARRPAALPDLLWDIECDRLLAMLQNWLLFESERPGPALVPVSLERPFGNFPGVEGSAGYRVQGNGRVLEFRGRIDRIDLSSDGRHARVVDYKTGNLPKTMSGRSRTLLMAGEKIQLAVYCGALSVLTDLAHLERTEGEYLHLQPSDGAVAPCAYSCEELRAALHLLPEMLQIIQTGIEQGAFFDRARGSVRPAGHCDYCDFLLICGKDREQRQARKSGDPAVARFAKLAEIDGLVREDEE